MCFQFLVLKFFGNPKTPNIRISISKEQSKPRLMQSTYWLISILRPMTCYPSLHLLVLFYLEPSNKLPAWEIIATCLLSLKEDLAGWMARLLRDGSTEGCRRDLLAACLQSLKEELAGSMARLPQAGNTKGRGRRRQTHDKPENVGTLITNISFWICTFKCKESQMRMMVVQDKTLKYWVTMDQKKLHQPFYECRKAMQR